MKLIRTEEAVGHVLCHDMTQIIKDQYLSLIHISEPTRLRRISYAVFC